MSCEKDREDIVKQLFDFKVICLRPNIIIIANPIFLNSYNYWLSASLAYLQIETYRYFRPDQADLVCKSTTKHT